MPFFDERRLQRLEAKVDLILDYTREAVRSGHRSEQMERMIMSELTDAVAELGAAVAADTAVDSSAITLLNGLTALIADLQTQVGQAADVPAALAAVKAFKDTLGANQATLSAAVTANTPAAPPTP